MRFWQQPILGEHRSLSDGDEGFPIYFIPKFCFSHLCYLSGPLALETVALVTSSYLALIESICFLVGLKEMALCISLKSLYQF